MYVQLSLSKECFIIVSRRREKLGKEDLRVFNIAVFIFYYYFLFGLSVKNMVEQGKYALIADTSHRARNCY